MSIRLMIAPTFALLGCASAQDLAPAGETRQALPVREVTVFKDGHAFVLREGPLAAGAGGRVVLDELPQPLLGTFWPFATGGARVVSATAARERVESERTALDLRQLIEANVGANVVLIDVGNERFGGRLIGFPRREADEVERLDPSGGQPRLAEAGTLVLVATATGTRAIPLERVRDLEVEGELGARYTQDELRDRLTLRIEGSGAGATVGVAYVQKGLRWIPAYKLDIDGEGHARVELEATLVNDLIDLQDATVHLVIGVPRFETAGLIDPISLQEMAAQVASQMRGADRFSNFLSNALMAQTLDYRAEAESQAAPPAPSVEGGESNEDLFVFTLRHVTLARGERMVLPVQAFDLGYRDVFTLEVPVTPPMEIRDSFSGERVAELARLMAASKVMHVLRIENGSQAPLTTAPALVLREGRVLAQSLLTYTPIGATTDLPINAAVDVRVERTERETGRTPNAESWNGDKYGRIDMEGTVELINTKSEAVEIEVRRMVLGLADAVDGDGAMEQLSLAELWGGPDQPAWWGWWSWPYWWYHWNGVAQFEWTVKLEPGKSAALVAKWHYFWR